MLNGLPRILIVRLSAIGDVVRVLPALHALRSRFPHAQIDWVVEEKSAGVLSGHPALDQVLIFERAKGSALQRIRAFLQLCRLVRDTRYDIVLDFHGILKSGWLVRASRAKERYGFAPPRAQEASWWFTNRRVTLHSQQMNRIDENLELCKALGAKSHDLDVAIAIDDEVLDEVEQHMETVFMGGKRLALLHAPVERPEKQWPLEHFAALADMLLADGRFEVMLTWGPGQLAVAEAVQEKSRRKPALAPETPDLKHFAALAQCASVFLGGDTGPMHIASAVGVPVVAIFGGTDPAKHAPMRPPCETLYAGPANPPNPIPLKQAQEYLSRITPEMAYDACVRIATK